MWVHVLISVVEYCTIQYSTVESMEITQIVA
jgi:hypothetical protein